MTHFLLIHGSWHGAWCWFKVLPRLGAHGAVSAVNLPGRGRDPAPLPSVDLDAMVAAAEAQLPPDGKTTIVVHSRYGIVASALAERHASGASSISPPSCCRPATASRNGRRPTASR